MIYTVMIRLILKRLTRFRAICASLRQRQGRTQQRFAIANSTNFTFL